MFIQIILAMFSKIGNHNLRVFFFLAFIQNLSDRKNIYTEVNESYCEYRIINIVSYGIFKNIFILNIFLRIVLHGIQFHICHYFIKCLNTKEKVLPLKPRLLGLSLGLHLGERFVD